MWPVKERAPSGKTAKRSTADQALARGCHRFGNGATTRLVYEYETGFFAGITYEGEFTQRGFHHPFELTAEEARKEKNVERSLVVGHKDVALMALQMFAPSTLTGRKSKRIVSHPHIRLGVKANQRDSPTVQPKAVTSAVRIVRRMNIGK